MPHDLHLATIYKVQNNNKWKKKIMHENFFPPRLRQILITNKQ